LGDSIGTGAGLKEDDNSGLRQATNLQIVSRQTEASDSQRAMSPTGTDETARPKVLVLNFPQRPDRAQADREFLPAALSLIETPVSPIRVAFIYTFCAMLAILLAWSYFGYLDVYAVAPGKIQAIGRTKVVQPLTAGQVMTILAKDGDRVKVGDILVQLDLTEAQASYKAVESLLASQRGQFLRRKAEDEAGRVDTINVNPPVSWTDEIPEQVRKREEQALAADLTKLAASLANLQAQRRLKISQRDKYVASISVETAQIAVISERASMYEALWKDGWASRAQYLTLLQSVLQAKSVLTTLQGNLAEAEAAILVLDEQIIQARGSFAASNIDALTLVDRQIDATAQDLIKASEKLKDMTLRAPIAGTVQASAVTTIGQVVTAGQQLMQVVPEGTPLEIEAYILNTDIGFVAVGQEATIKVDTFPYSRYGTIKGTVEKLANDAIPGIQGKQQQNNASQPPSLNGALSITTAAQSNQDLVFPVIIRPSQTSMNIDGRMVPLSSGMTVTVEIKTERRRAIDYILSPLIDVVSTAAHER
jgi:hemolysin D